MDRYVREDELIADAIKQTRRSAREANRPTGTEKARTKEVAEQAATDAVAAQSAADQAAADAVLAKSTADGRNRIYAQQVEPVTLPDLPFVQGDLWYRLDTLGRIAEVRIWNGTLWGPFQLVAGSLLVPGSVGNVLIGDGAIDGMTITGALIRTAVSGQRMQFDVNGLRAFNTAGQVTAQLYSAGGGMTLNGIMRSVDETAQLYSVMQPGSLQTWDNPGTIEERNVFQGSPTEFYSRRARPTISGAMTQASGTAGMDDATLAAWHLGVGPVGYRPSHKVEAIAGPSFTGLRFEHYGSAQTYGALAFQDGRFNFNSPVSFLGDTDWASVTPPAGVTGTVRWRRQNGRIYLEFYITTSTAIAHDALLNPAFTLPIAARPAESVPLLVAGAATSHAIGSVTPSSGIAAIRNLRGVGSSLFYGTGEWAAV